MQRVATSSRRSGATYIPEGCIRQFVFDGLPEQRRGRIVDRTGTGQAGTIYGFPAMQGDGAGSVTVDTEVDVLAGHQYGVFSGWLYPASGESDLVGVYEEYAEQLRLAVFCIGDAETMRIYASQDGSSSAASYDTAAILTNDTWQHVIIEVDSTNATVSVWVDGTKAVDGAALSGSVGEFSAAALNGQRLLNNAEHALQFCGIRGSDSPITADEVQRLYDFPENGLAAIFGTGDALYWKLNEGAGTHINGLPDGTGDATMSGYAWDFGANIVGAKFDDGLEFDAANTYVNIGSETDIDRMTELTWQALYETDDDTTNQTFAAKDNVQTRMLLFTGDGPYFQVRTIGGDNATSYKSSGAGAANNWRTCEARLSLSDAGPDSDSKIDLFFDGAEIGSYADQTAGAGTPTESTAANLWIGARDNGGPDDVFDGHIREFRIYNRPLTDRELLASATSLKSIHGKL